MNGFQYTCAVALYRGHIPILYCTLFVWTYEQIKKVSTYEILVLNFKNFSNLLKFYRFKNAFDLGPRKDDLENCLHLGWSLFIRFQFRNDLSEIVIARRELYWNWTRLSICFIVVYVNWKWWASGIGYPVQTRADFCTEVNIDCWTLNDKIVPQYI